MLIAIKFTNTEVVARGCSVKKLFFKILQNSQKTFNVWPLTFWSICLQYEVSRGNILKTTFFLNLRCNSQLSSRSLVNQKIDSYCYTKNQNPVNIYLLKVNNRNTKK